MKNPKKPNLVFLDKQVFNTVSLHPIPKTNQYAKIYQIQTICCTAWSSITSSMVRCQ